MQKEVLDVSTMDQLLKKCLVSETLCRHILVTVALKTTRELNCTLQQLEYGDYEWVRKKTEHLYTVIAFY